MQTSGIPDDLYERVYDFCKKLLTLPKPYCTIGLHYARQLKLERAVPALAEHYRVSLNPEIRETVLRSVDPRSLRAWMQEAEGAENRLHIDIAAMEIRLPYAGKPRSK
ncbi:UNVERIFIED_CONTAM: hypothetical protein K2H54_000283 [Gekko kuhli]